MQQAASHKKYIFSVTCPVCSLAGTITIPRPAYFCYKKENQITNLFEPLAIQLKTRLTESWSLVVSNGEAIGRWGGAGTLWMETPGPTSLKYIL